MKKISLFLFIMLLCFMQDSMAQDIKGKVTDDNDIPLEFVNVDMRTLPDSAFVDGMVTANDGTFKLSGQCDIVHY